ncbi:hypothetical protein BS47DRAFT_1363986 [Hydnum rufescens UP504]|uniref:Uncharacterized protein n=1 Tax=Hydnum rufescens UP504 TaxID=1448309 RepID=A0A9P6ASZ8_9AGAM|nr:hypothetical protein BS47DRAFT_1363986 [Hydnum rufescens UP504]
MTHQMKTCPLDKKQGMKKATKRQHTQQVPPRNHTPTVADSNLHKPPTTNLPNEDPVNETVDNLVNKTLGPTKSKPSHSANRAPHTHHMADPQTEVCCTKTHTPTVGTSPEPEVVKQQPTAQRDRKNPPNNNPLNEHWPNGHPPNKTAQTTHPLWQDIT